MYSFKCENVNLPTVKILNVKRQNFTSNVKIWKYHTSDAARLL